MTPADLALIRDTIQREIRDFALVGAPERPVLPLPVDGAAEAEVSSAIVGGCITLEDVPGLRPKYFGHPLHRVVIEVAPQCPIDSDCTLSIEYLEHQLLEAGHRGDLEAWLITLRDAIPFRGRESCLVAAARVRELWRRRRLIERLRRLVVALKTDTMSTDDALAEIKTFNSSGPSRAKAA